jgi:diaminohydroxyphosphoribosylaminopyrimidine deaminase/5-amino-6-(5-phosphoribosylamino)uracil reductase
VTGAMATTADFMDRALFLAARGRGRTSPNPMVGAVVVDPAGVVVGDGFHERAGEPHAEVKALDAAGGRARGATLYCTLEPCCHVGRTGPCVERIVQAGIARVVAAVEDPDPRVRGGGFTYLREHGVEVVVGPGAERAERLNAAFFSRMRERRPFVTLKAAMSRDGRIAAAPGQRTLLTSDAANRHAQRVRAEIDAVAVGSGTLLIDDPRLTARGACRERPLVRVVFDRRLRTPPAAAVLSTLAAGPVIIVTSAEAFERADLRTPLEARGAIVKVAAGPGIREALEALVEHDVGSLLLEGGAAVHRAAWEAGVVDFVRVYVTPHLLGAGGVPFLDETLLEPGALDDRRTETMGPDIMIEGYVHRTR